MANRFDASVDLVNTSLVKTMRMVKLSMDSPSRRARTLLRREAVESFDLIRSILKTLPHVGNSRMQMNRLRTHMYFTEQDVCCCGLERRTYRKLTCAQVCRRHNSECMDYALEKMERPQRPPFFQHTAPASTPHPYAE